MKKTFLTVLLVLAALALVSCDQDEKVVYVYVDEDNPPPVPQGVTSVTADEEVHIYWLPIDDVVGDFDTYVVYRSDYHPDTGYWEIGTTDETYFVDDSVNNGWTYYYAVSSVDYDGNLSDLSYEEVFDTPRPEGYDVQLNDSATAPGSAGWDFSSDRVVDYRSIACDFYLEYNAGDDAFYFNVTDIAILIQDMGHTANLDDVSYSPAHGWSQNGWCEVILAHTYVFRTYDNHYAKVRVTSIGSDYILFDWAYQIDEGNRELKPLVNKNPNYLRYPRDGS